MERSRKSAARFAACVGFVLLEVRLFKIPNPFNFFYQEVSIFQCSHFRLLVNQDTLIGSPWGPYGYFYITPKVVRQVMYKLP